MNILDHYVFPRMEEVVRLIGEDPFRTDFGGSDIPTLICLVLLFVMFDEGDREAIIAHVLRVSLYKESQIILCWISTKVGTPTITFGVEMRGVSIT